MKLKIIAVGKIKDEALRRLINDYQKKINSYMTLDIMEVEDEAISKNSNPRLDQQIKEKEGQRVLAKIKPGEFVILLDLHESKQYDSLAWASHLDDLCGRATQGLTFVIGGSLGVGENLRQRADESINLSAMTFTHQITRLLLLEQIYRAFKINKHETYHK